MFLPITYSSYLYIYLLTYLPKRYIFKKKWLRALPIYGHTSHSNSKSDVIIPHLSFCISYFHFLIRKLKTCTVFWFHHFLLPAIFSICQAFPTLLSFIPSPPRSSPTTTPPDVSNPSKRYRQYSLILLAAHSSSRLTCVTKLKPDRQFR